MKIAFHYHVPSIEKGNAVFMPAYLGLFIDSIAPHFESIDCLLYQPTASEVSMMDYEIKSKNVQLIELGEKTSIPKRYLQSGVAKAKLKEVEKRNDAILVRASTPLVPFIKSTWHKPSILMLVSDATLGLDNLPQPGWRRSLIKTWANWYASQELKLAQRSMTVVNSQMLYDTLEGKIQRLHLLQTTTLRLSDFRDRTDTCLGDRIRLIFAGRITRIKGILDIIQAMAQLRSEGFDLEFNLVGMLDQKGGFLDEINAFAEENNVADFVKYLGYRTAGDELLEEYRKSDVFVIASQASSEGFPRTLWEAMASSMPIVATAVSSIPAFTQGAAELSEPKNATDFAAKLRTVLTKPGRRREMILKGRELAKSNTLEVRGEQLSDMIKKYVSE